MENICPVGRKMAGLWPKKRMSIYGIISILRAILAHKLAKYQYFAMGPILFDNYY